MNKFTFTQFKKHSIFTAFLITTLGMSGSYALGTVVYDPSANMTLQNIQSEIPASYKGLATLLNYAYFNTDDLFPTFNTNGSTLNPLTTSQTNGDKLTQQHVDNQLKSVAYKLNKSYKAFANNDTDQLPQPSNDPNAANNLINTLTTKTPSWDTLRLPWSPLQGSTFYNNSLDAKALTQTYNNNAKYLNFDAFFDGKTTDDNGPNNASPKASYIDYAMQTYQPLLAEDDSAQDSNGTASTQNESLFDAINDHLMDLKGSDKGEEAYTYLNSILNNQKFQKFWLALRSYEAQRSLLLSNFNFLKTERTPQKGLGTSYNLVDSKNQPIHDASPLQVEQYQINNTVYNPQWYKQMKTASPATLAREQLYLTSLLLKVQYKNQLLNERLLATQTMTANGSFQTNRKMLNMQETQLKQILFASAPQAQQPPATPTQYQNQYSTQTNQR